MEGEGKILDKEIGERKSQLESLSKQGSEITGYFYKLRTLLSRLGHDNVHRHWLAVVAKDWPEQNRSYGVAFQREHRGPARSAASRGRGPRPLTPTRAVFFVKISKHKFTQLHNLVESSRTPTSSNKFTTLPGFGPNTTKLSHF